MDDQPTITTAMSKAKNGSIAKVAGTGVKVGEHVIWNEANGKQTKLIKMEERKFADDPLTHLTTHPPTPPEQDSLSSGDDLSSLSPDSSDSADFDEASDSSTTFDDEIAREQKNEDLETRQKKVQKMSEIG